MKKSLTLLLLIPIAALAQGNAWVCERCTLQATEPTCELDGFDSGTLWKPRGENSSSLVILIRSDYPDFDFCEVRLRNGVDFERLTFTGRSNPDRLTYRGDFPGGKAYAGKRKNGGVRCWLDGACTFFPIPGPPKSRHE